MNHSESLTKLAAAMSKAQGEIENASKNATNPHFGSHYADLAEIINTVRPVLTKHGLSVVQLPGFEDGVATVETILIHESGEWLSGVSGAPIQKRDPQGVGSALTYLRRYSLAAVCAIAQEDDDGHAASKPAANGTAAKATDKLVDEVRQLWFEAKSLGLDKAEPDRMGKASDAIKDGDAKTLRAAAKWLKTKIEEAKVPA